MGAQGCSDWYVSRWLFFFPFLFLPLLIEMFSNGKSACASATGLPKAEYAVGYFTEMGIGCRRDPLEANVWYVRAADQGDERAKHRIAAIRAAASGGSRMPPREMIDGKKEEEEKGKAGGGKKWGLF